MGEIQNCSEPPAGGGLRATSERRHAIVRGTASLSAVAVVALVLAACSSSGKSGGTSGTTGSTTSPVTSGSASTGSGDTSSIVADAKKVVEQGYAGLYTKPADGPAAQKGKNVWIVSCTQLAPSCAGAAVGVQEAAKVLGWKTTVVDGKGTPAGYTTAVRQAIVAHADGIVTIGLDCNAKSALEDAKKANIPTVGVFAYDCNDPALNAGPSVYSAMINNNGTSADFGTLWGKLRADYAIAATNGKAKVIELKETDFALGIYEDKGFTSEMAKCSGCSIVAKLEIPVGDLGTPVAAQKVATVLQQHPEATVLQVASDTLLGVTAQAIKTAKQSRPDLVVIGGEGYGSTLDLVRSGVATVCVAIPTNWLGWSGADAMNRLFAGETTIPNEGASFQLIDKDHGLPAKSGDGWTPHVDYKAAFTQIWTK